MIDFWGIGYDIKALIAQRFPLADARLGRELLGAEDMTGTLALVLVLNGSIMRA